MKRKAVSECDQDDYTTLKRFRPEHKRDFFTPVHQHSIESWERLIRIASYPHSTAHHNKKIPFMKRPRALSVNNSRKKCKVERNAVRRPLPGGGSLSIGKPTAPVSYPELEIGPSSESSPLKQSNYTTGLKDGQEQASKRIQQPFRAPLPKSKSTKLVRNHCGSGPHSALSNSNGNQPSNQSATMLDQPPGKTSRKIDQGQKSNTERWLSLENTSSPSNVNTNNADSTINLISPEKRSSPPSNPSLNYYLKHQQINGSHASPQKHPMVPPSPKRSFQRHLYPTGNAQRQTSSYNHTVSAQGDSYQASQNNPQSSQPSLRNGLQSSHGKPHPNRNAYLKAKSMQATCHKARSIQPAAYPSRTFTVEKYNVPFSKQKHQPSSTAANDQKNRAEPSAHKSPVQLVDICKDFHLLGGDLKKLQELQIAQFPFLIVPKKPNNAVHPLTALQLRLRDKYTAYLVQIIQHLDYIAVMEGTPISLKHIETIVDIFGQELTFLKSKVSALALTYALYDVVFAKPHIHLYGHNCDIVPRECWQVCRKLYHIWSHLISSLPYRLFYLRYHARHMGQRLAKSPLQLTLLMMIQTHNTMQPEKKEIERTSMHPILRADSLTFDGPVRDFPIFSLEEDCFV
jgi:hypothetical protein